MVSNRFLKITVFSLVGLAVFLAGFVLTRKSVENQQALINNSLVARFDQPEEKRTEPTGIFNISRDKANFSTLANGGREIWYYNQDNGEIRSVSTSNLVGGTKLVTKIKPGANHIGWANNNKLVAQYSSGSIFYDLDLNFSQNYDNSIKNPVLNKTGDKIAYNHFDQTTGEGSIKISDPQIQSSKNILATRFEGWQISWVDNETLALTKPPTLDNTAISLFLLDINSGGLQTIAEFRKNLEQSWSQTGKRLLFSNHDIATEKNGLFTLNLSTKQETDLQSDWKASDCVWSIDDVNIFCAAKDGFYSIETTSVKPTPKKIVYEAPEDLTIEPANVGNLTLTSAEDYLIFKSLKDGKLYGLKVTKTL